MSCFPPLFEMMQNWSSFHQAGCSCLLTNQRPPQENSNCGEKHILHYVNKYYKILVGCCNCVLGLIRYESRMVPEDADTISTPENWLQNLFGLHRRCAPPALPLPSPSSPSPSFILVLPIQQPTRDATRVTDLFDIFTPSPLPHH